jgi:GNAT superfamily N-acetyltransferase
VSLLLLIEKTALLATSFTVPLIAFHTQTNKKLLHNHQGTMGSIATVDNHYTVLRIPATSPRLDELAEKFREIRLEAIKANPAGSFVLYGLEYKHPLSVWRTRISGDVTCLVCVSNADPALSSEEVLLSADWAGFAFVKCMSIEEYYSYPEMGQVVSKTPEIEIRWHFYDLYTIPAHRGRNVGSKLVKASLTMAEEALRLQGPANGTVHKIGRMRLMAQAKQLWLVNWYRQFGFNDNGMATLVQGLTANNMRDSIPPDTNSTEQLRARWETPIGLVMEKIIEIV